MPEYLQMYESYESYGVRGVGAGACQVGQTCLFAHCRQYSYHTTPHHTTHTTHHTHPHHAPRTTHTALVLIDATEATASTLKQRSRSIRLSGSMPTMLTSAVLRRCVLQVRLDYEYTTPTTRERLSFESGLFVCLLGLQT